jgi:hydrogenase maturation protease
LGVEAKEYAGEALDLLETWNRGEEAILVDSAVTGGAPGAILQWDANEIPLGHAGFRSSTHAFGLVEAIELARALGRLPKRVTVYGIEGARFDCWGAPSLEVSLAVERLAQAIAAEQAARSGAR